MMLNQPNIVIIIADDVTPSYHGCYGGPTPTPNIDRLSREGMRFERGYCCSSLCCPSRYTLFTGRYAGRSRTAIENVPSDEPCLISQNAMLDPDTPTLPRMLRAAGYYTGHIGKWHSRFDTKFMNVEEPTLPREDPDDPMVDAEIRRRQKVAQEVVRRCAGFEHVDCVQWGNISGKEHPKLAIHNVAWMTDGALAFLDEAARKKRPFYLHIANSMPHGPSPDKSLQQDHRYTWGGKLEHSPRSHPPDETVLSRLRTTGLQTHGPIAGVNAGMIMLDDQVGAVIRRLDELNLAHDTIVIYTADHGIPGKGLCYAMGTRLPLVMRWPAMIPADSTFEGIFSWVDLVPTLTEACGMKPPTDTPYDGISCYAAMRDPHLWKRKVAYHEMGWARSIIKGRYQLISLRYPQWMLDQMRCEKAQPSLGVMFDKLNGPSFPDYFQVDQLYDLATDPLERVNLISDPSRALIVEDLRAELRIITSTMPRPFKPQADEYCHSEHYQQLVQQCQEELRKIHHYPSGDSTRIWLANLADPDAPMISKDNF